MIAVCKRHGIVACHQCSPKTPFNQISTENPYKWTKEDMDEWKKAIEELNKQPVPTWNTDKVIEFVNWYIDLKNLGENNKLENQTIVDSFLDGDSVDVWKFPEIFSFLRKNFTYDNEDAVFQSKKRKLGASAGDDSSLFISSCGFGTMIWWRNNRGEEDTIFYGKGLKTEEEFNQVFEFLGIKEILKWT